MRKILVSLLSVLLLASCLLSFCSCAIFAPGNAPVADSGAKDDNGVDIVLSASRDMAAGSADDEDSLDVVFAGASSDEEIFAVLPEVDAPDETPASVGLRFKLIELGKDEDGNVRKAYSVIDYDRFGLADEAIISENVYIPYTYEGLPVVEIAHRAFENVKVKNITLPKTLLKISPRAFMDCTVESLVIPSSVLYIAGDAFVGCNKLASLAVEDGNARYSMNGNFLMDGTVLLRGVGNGTIGADVTEIAPYAFKGCNALTTITVPATVTKIGVGAFAACPYLASATIETEITKLPDNIFDGSTALWSVSLPESVTEYGYAAFRGTGFNAFEVPANVVKIASSAFADCKSLASITLNEGLEAIGGSVFQNCASLTGVVMPNGLLSVGGYAFNGCTALSYVWIAPTVTSIGDAAFYGCVLLKSVYFPSSVVELGSAVFYDVDKSCVISIETTYVPSKWASNWNVYRIDNALESGKIPVVMNYLSVKKGVPAPAGPEGVDPAPAE